MITLSMRLTITTCGSQHRAKLERRPGSPRNRAARLADLDESLAACALRALSSLGEGAGRKAPALCSLACKTCANLGRAAFVRSILWLRGSRQNLNPWVLTGAGQSDAIALAKDADEWRRCFAVWGTALDPNISTHLPHLYVLVSHRSSHELDSSRLVPPYVHVGIPTEPAHFFWSYADSQSWPSDVKEDL